MGSAVTPNDIDAHFERRLEISSLTEETRANARALLLWAYEVKCHGLREAADGEASLYTREFPLVSLAVARGLRHHRSTGFDRLDTSWSHRGRKTAEEYLTCLIQYEEILPFLTIWRTGLVEAKCFACTVRLEIPYQVRQWLHLGWQALAKRQLLNIAQNTALVSLMYRLRVDAARTARTDGSSLRWDLKPNALRQFYRAVYDFSRVDHLLPENWAFPNYTLRDFRAFHAYLWTLADLHIFVAHNVLWRRGKRPGPSDLLILRTPSAWIGGVSEVTGLSHDVAQALLNDLSRDPWDIGRNVFFQPLWRAAGQLILSPHLLLSTNGEVHFNRVIASLYPSEYSKATRIKEDVMVHELKAAFGRLPNVETYQVRFPAQLKLPDVDLLVIDYRLRAALCLELKWVLPALSRYDAMRDDQLAKGLQQCRAIKAAIDRDPDILARALGRRTLEITRIAHALVSKNHIGGPENLAGDIPVLNLDALYELIRSARSLPHLVDLLETRAFLAGIVPPELAGQRWQCGSYTVCAVPQDEGRCLETVSSR